jgi:NTP pyrophosphatase (non-canonical NTP hydrolase)
VSDLTFDQVSETNRARCKVWHQSGSGWTGADWSNAMCGEAGETANVVKKLRRSECGMPGSLDPDSERLREMLSAELADTFLYLDLLATFYEIDLPAAIISKFNSVSEREGFTERLPV